MFCLKKRNVCYACAGKYRSTETTVIQSTVIHKFAIVSENIKFSNLNLTEFF